MIVFSFDDQVYVASIGADTLKHRMKVAKQLWRSNISAEYSHHENPKLKRQLDEALARGVPIMVVFGEEEMRNGTIKVKDIKAHTEEEVALENMANVVAQKLRL